MVNLYFGLMKNLLLPCLLLLLQYHLSAQSKSEVDRLLKGDMKVPEVLLVGTFHFGYPGLDAHKTADSIKVDVKSPQRQKEVQELVDYIARFRPTKILVETGRNTGYLLHRYREWKTGKIDLRKREIDQVGFRLMDRFEIDTLYGIDAASLSWELGRTKDSVLAKPFMDRLYQSHPDSLFASQIDDNYWNWYDIQDERCVNLSLLEYFLEMNSEHHLRRMHGHYILKNQTNDYKSIDRLTLNWYSRNLRIFRNIQMVETSPDDRIMVLIGQAHVSILREQFLSSPEYQLIEFSEL